MPTGFSEKKFFFFFDFINFIENTQIPDNKVLATLDVGPLYTNIPQKEGIEVVCRYYKDFFFF